ncbi:hypothetical protein GWI33_022257 [Rhynchophorus ferrugineus]|uniref:Uncharacterized protein n=1 Tax=Rhynchophorus ferrugineus TaxID=354439 RepID=A0A834MHP2_RHYFE|nr:hypothetical protein GWI33_022257 [Rhynchophorus ferrugineus]
MKRFLPDISVALGNLSVWNVGHDFGYLHKGQERKYSLHKRGDRHSNLYLSVPVKDCLHGTLMPCSSAQSKKS